MEVFIIKLVGITSSCNIAAFKTLITMLNNIMLVYIKIRSRK